MIAEFAIYPLDKEKDISRDVAKAVEELNRSGVEYFIGPMGTSLEGEPREVFDAIRQCYEKVCEDHGRVILTLTADSRDVGTLEELVESVQQKLGSPEETSQRKAG